MLIWFEGKSRISRFPKKVLKHQILAIVNVKIVEIIISSRVRKMLMAHLNPVRGGFQKHLELGNEVCRHQLTSELGYFGHVAQKSHHVSQKVVLFGEFLKFQKSFVN